MAKRIGRYFLFCMTALGAWSARGMPWKLQRDSDRVYAVNPEMPALKVHLDHDLGPVRLVDWKSAPVSTSIGLLIYESGFVGTQRGYRVERAIIIDRARQKIIGDAFWKMEPVNPRETIAQPVWDWKPRKVTVTNPDVGTQRSFRW